MCCLTYNVKKTTAVRSRIMSKPIFASRVWCFGRAYFENGLCMATLLRVRDMAAASTAVTISELECRPCFGPIISPFRALALSEYRYSRCPLVYIIWSIQIVVAGWDLLLRCCEHVFSEWGLHGMALLRNVEYHNEQRSIWVIFSPSFR